MASGLNLTSITHRWLTESGYTVTAQSTDVVCYVLAGEPAQAVFLARSIHLTLEDVERILEASGENVNAFRAFYEAE